MSKRFNAKEFRRIVIKIGSFLTGSIFLKLNSLLKGISNVKGNFTNPELFTENGGHITRRHRRAFNFIHDKKATFQEYFKEFFQKPYDNLASLTIDNCDYVIRYKNIANDYLTALKKAGVTNPRPLPVANKTVGKKKDVSEYYTDEIKEKAISVFGPFLEKYNYSFPEAWGEVRSPIKSRLQFRALGVLRKLNQRYFKKNTEKFGLQGTIYGDIQRDELKGYLNECGIGTLIQWSGKAIHHHVNLKFNYELKKTDEYFKKILL